MARPPKQYRITGLPPEVAEAHGARGNAAVMTAEQVIAATGLEERLVKDRLRKSGHRTWALLTETRAQAQTRVRRSYSAGTAAILQDKAAEGRLLSEERALRPQMRGYRFGRGQNH